MKRGSNYGSFDELEEDAGAGAGAGAGASGAGSAAGPCCSVPKKPCLTEGHKFDDKPIACYLAGRISHSDWRRQLCAKYDICETGGVDGSLWPTSVPMQTPLNVVCNGPFAASVIGGAWGNKHTPPSASYLRHGGRVAARIDESYDACVYKDGAKDEKARMAPQAVVKLCLGAIRACDVVFAWVDGEPGEGTLFELGYAVALGKRVVIAYPHVDTVANAWFAALACTQQIEAPTPAEAFAAAFAPTPATTLVHELARRTTAVSRGL
jgi:nucleoside 2-deoxyribosyltransferase